MVKNILITGGAGYIGSHIAEILLKQKKKIFLIDNLSTGYKKLINKKAKFFKIDIQNAKKISTSTLMEDEKDGVYLTPAHVHKALRKYLGITDKPESEKFPFPLIEDIAFFG